MGHRRKRFPLQSEKIPRSGPPDDGIFSGVLEMRLWYVSYANMRPIIENHMELVDEARHAFEACGVKPIVQPIRGGTDGARLSHKGLPCPNLSTGGYLFHSRYEFIPQESLETMVDVLEKLIVGLSK